jgi:HNH endonuclease
MIMGIPMVIEHIIPLVGGGSSTPDNLCLACYRCNEFKGSRTEVADPIDGKFTVFFHPRLQRWSEHFAWREHSDTMDGLTSCGRTTIVALRLNNGCVGEARRLWMLVRLHQSLESQALPVRPFTY